MGPARLWNGARQIYVGTARTTTGTAGFVFSPNTLQELRAGSRRQCGSCERATALGRAAGARAQIIGSET
eukprot:7220811-Pyramimonas_sp.AAC.1